MRDRLLKERLYRWRETDGSGDRVKRKIVVGTKTQFPTKASAIKQIAGLGLEINCESPASATVTIKELVEHYRVIELAAQSGKTQRTISVYEQQLRQYILPKWGQYQIGQVKTVAVEAWLKTLPGAPATKAKTRNVLSSLYQHARRYELATSNPISQLRQGAGRLKEPEVLIPEEVNALLAELQEPARTIVHLAAHTGLRRGELFGLKWEDVDLERGHLRIVRSIVDQAEGETKTRGSKRPLPIPEDLVAGLRI